MSMLGLRVKKKKLSKTTKEIIADAIREGKNAYEIASLVKLTDDDVRYAAKALHMTRALNANEGCVTRQATTEEMGLDELKEKLGIGPDEDVEFMEAPKPPEVVSKEPEPEKPRKRGRKPKAAVEAKEAAEAEAPRTRRKAGPKPRPKKERQVVVPGEALLGTIRILEGIGNDMFAEGAQDEESGTWLGFTYDQVVTTLKLLRTIDRICQRLSH
ncbi:MAG: hypothetical protein IJS96_08915 [Schwartzia sp.]|nr:hypothetical protein [Schwartzia sp. (in: firmicutes)]